MLPDTGYRTQPELCTNSVANQHHNHLFSVTILLAVMTFLLLLLLNPEWAIGQTEVSKTDSTLQTRLSQVPSSSITHGSISGSEPNPQADHLLGELFDQFSDTNRLDLELYGYFQQGVTLNPASPDDRLNGPVLNNYRSNAFQLNGLYLVGERKIDADSPDIQLGGRVGMLYGTDAAFGLSDGLDANIVSDDASRFNKLAFPQLYGNLFLPYGSGVSFKFGKFFSPIGNEWLYSAKNFFYSHFLSWNLQPGTHTGVLAETKFHDNWVFRFGPNFGWNTSENSNHATSYLSTIQWTSPDKHSQIYFAIQSGDQSTVITTADSNVVNYSLIVNQDLRHNWHYMLEHDLLTSHSRTGVARNNFETYSLAQYLFYKMNEQYRFGIRFEWLRDDDGILKGFDPMAPSAPGSYYNLTLGMNWYPRPYLRVRPEIRWDTQIRDSAADTPAFDDGTSTSQLLLACDILLEF
ncbi:outer membrane beta-barrel protein [uncultured Gimesia sp.]|uniref:outer membrane beta-barrel protein n=1 Tax=uncultured Gimesia sp. TaxID=1678688 RepID=UPI0030DD0308|tara:strand:- start:14545 stop:15933 length:1389 start_codon:yes stop_codon:yes gene_type:complete